MNILPFHPKTSHIQHAWHGVDVMCTSRCVMDLRSLDQREHAPTCDGLSPLVQPDEALADRIRAELVMQRYRRDLAKREGRA